MNDLDALQDLQNKGYHVDIQPYPVRGSRYPNDGLLNEEINYRLTATKDDTICAVALAPDIETGIRRLAKRVPDQVPTESLIVSTSREVVIMPGQTYIVMPLNPRKKKNRGRRVLIVSLTRDIKDHNGVKGKYLDNNRPGSPDLGDLDYLPECY